MQNRKINKQSTSLGKFGNFVRSIKQIKEDKCRVVTKFHRRGRFEFVELVSDPFVYIYNLNKYVQTSSYMQRGLRKPLYVSKDRYIQ